MYKADLYYTVLYCTVLYCLYCIILYCIVLHCVVSYCIILYYILLDCFVLYSTVLYCITLCYIILCCTVLYCIVLHCIDCIRSLLSEVSPASTLPETSQSWRGSSWTLWRSVGGVGSALLPPALWVSGAVLLRATGQRCGACPPPLWRTVDNDGTWCLGCPTLNWKGLQTEYSLISHV